jgi:hypothetical protein
MKIFMKITFTQLPGQQIGEMVQAIRKTLADGGAPTLTLTLKGVETHPRRPLRRKLEFHPMAYRSANDQKRGVVSAWGALTDRRVKTKRPRVALFSLGYSFTLASTSARSCGTDGTLPHLHSPKSIPLLWRRSSRAVALAETFAKPS